MPGVRDRQYEPQVHDPMIYSLAPESDSEAGGDAEGEPPARGMAAAEFLSGFCPEVQAAMAQHLSRPTRGQAYKDCLIARTFVDLCERLDIDYSQPKSLKEVTDLETGWWSVMSSEDVLTWLDPSLGVSKMDAARRTYNLTKEAGMLLRQWGAQGAQGRAMMCPTDSMNGEAIEIMQKRDLIIPKEGNVSALHEYCRTRARNGWRGEMKDIIGRLSPGKQSARK